MLSEPSLCEKPTCTPPVPLPSLSRSTTATSLTETCSQESVEVAMQYLQAEINFLDDNSDQENFISSPSEIMLQRYQNILEE